MGPEILYTTGAGKGGVKVSVAIVPSSGGAKQLVSEISPSLEAPCLSPPAILALALQHCAHQGMATTIASDSIRVCEWRIPKNGSGFVRRSPSDTELL